MSAPEAQDAPTDPAVSRDDARLSASMSQVARELERSRASDFSPRAQATLLELHAEYLQDVGTQAVREAHRAHADVVSASHVRHADGLVRSRQRNLSSLILNSVGGVFGGAGVSQLYSVLSAETPSTLAYALAAGGTVLGAVLLTAGIVRS